MRYQILRAGLALFAIGQIVLGAWAYLFPLLFYDGFPTVSLNPPFNEHFVSDTGGLFLANAVVLSGAAIYMERHLVQTALLSYFVFAIAHLVFHARHLEGFPLGDAVFVVVVLGLQVVFVSILFVLALQGSGDFKADKAAVPKSL